MRALGIWLGIWLLLLAGCQSLYGGFAGPNPEDCTYAGCSERFICDSVSHTCIDDPCPVSPGRNTPADGVAISCALGTPPAIDGRLDEWQGAQWTPVSRSTVDYFGGTWSNKPEGDDLDARAQFSLRWDDEYLYTAARIADDIVANFADGEDLYLQDSIEFYYDGQVDPKEKYGNDDYQFVFTPPPDGRRQAFKDGLPGNFPREVRSAAQRLDGEVWRWSVEVAIPWSQLGPHKELLGRVLGFDVQLNDHDDPAGRPNQSELLIWRRVPASCSCDADCRPYCVTAAFGRGSLVGRVRVPPS